MRASKSVERIEEVLIKPNRNLPEVVNELTTLYTEMVEGELRGFVDWLPKNLDAPKDTMYMPEIYYEAVKNLLGQYLLERKRQ